MTRNRFWSLLETPLLPGKFQKNALMMLVLNLKAGKVPLLDDLDDEISHFIGDLFIVFVGLALIEFRIALALLIKTDR